jgi:hypothetical protein
MSELSSQALEHLTKKLVAAGISTERASDLAILNSSTPIVEGGKWIILDEQGHEVVQVPAPPYWADSAE